MPSLRERGRGFEIGAVAADEFRDFARHFATSPEIGRIATALDGDTPLAPGSTRTLGPTGCGRVCGVACCTLVESRIGGSHACKLDPVIVDPRVRRRGLATALVTRLFIDTLGESDNAISSIYAHAVHSATARLLGGLAFHKAPARGAPLSSFRLDPSSRDHLVARCRDRLRGISARLKLSCVYCLKADKRARPWCAPPPSSASSAPAVRPVRSAKLAACPATPIDIGSG